MKERMIISVLQGEKVVRSLWHVKKHISYLGPHFCFTRKYPTSIQCGNVCIWLHAEFIINNIQRLSTKEAHYQWSEVTGNGGFAPQARQRGGLQINKSPFHISLWHTMLSSFLLIIKHIGVYDLRRPCSWETQEVKVSSKREQLISKSKEHSFGYRLSHTTTK